MDECFPVVVTEESPKMRSTGMTPDELRVTKFRESCTFKAMFSCAGGHCPSLILDPAVDHCDVDALAQRRLKRNANAIDSLLRVIEADNSRSTSVETSQLEHQ
jgi:hypothetical protein